MAEQRIYLFKRFERFWHWSQTLLIIAMLYTGFAIHGYLGGLEFRTSLLIHEYAAWLLMILWVFAIFWHFTTGEWKQYIPTFRKITLVARHYAWGMFRGESHPYHATPLHKHNPLQRLAYLWLKLMINPLIWASGLLLLFFSYDWIRLSPLGLNLTEVAWTHTVAAYMMLLFFIAHVYLATTGHTPLTYIKAMVTGWETSDDEPQDKSPSSAGA
ncbi:putative Transmembrane di-heme cytochrome [Thiomonas sp. X19]|uniref:cytochrome b/b6 domain-containing protein n=1 Tax=Thiomonas sp. X19 TaxID=1050370 RepID=UPI000B72DC96|nr:cytochrome b/b6 domain-containing protein [Thiomonas sp. X19]SCC93782.1 putative Transmembrane di-heme cytochrome [Thiomonas sp. X19]